MCFTDPPYNVDYGNHGGAIRSKRKRTIANDALRAEEWGTFCRAWASNLLANVEGAIYVCMSTREWASVSKILSEAGAHSADTIIWAKDRLILGWGDYHSQYEPIWYGWPSGANHYWCGDRTQGNLWQFERPFKNDLHPTMKPLPIIERAIENSSWGGDVVLDLFLGSGSTMIAAERTGRLCWGMEIDARYVDVAIRRWEAFAGEQAKKVSAEGRE